MSNRSLSARGGSILHTPLPPAVPLKSKGKKESLKEEPWGSDGDTEL